MIVETWSFEGVALPGGTDIAIGVDRGRVSATPPPGAPQLPGRFVLPGLVDAHAHLTLGSGTNGPVGLDRDGLRANLRAARALGVLAIRDAGAVGGLTLSIDEGEEPLPSVLAAGRFLAPAGQYFAAVHDPVAPEDLVRAALAELAAGAAWVKLIGDFPVDLEGPSLPTYDDATIRALCQSVHAAGGRIAAHTQTDRVAALVEAGIDSVEHGDALDEDVLRSMASRGVAWTPTLSAGAARQIDAVPERARARVAAVRDRFHTLLPLARHLGVTVLAGTDVSGPLHGEVAHLIEFGVEPADALAAASTAARAFLGLAALDGGAPADLVTFDVDPRDDPGVLAQPVAVVLGGQRVA